MTTGWKKLTRRDITTFDDFATDAVIAAMELGGIGRIQSNGHAKIKGVNGNIITISRDTSGPHIRGNMMTALKRAFPELKSDSQEDIVTSASTSPETGQALLGCPAKGCEQEFATPEALQEHVGFSHYTCKWEGCDMGPDGTAFVGKTRMSVAGHINIRHKGNKPWEHNQQQANAKRAATVAARKAKEAQEAPVVKLVDVHGHPAVVAPAMPEQVAVPPVAGVNVESIGGKGVVMGESVADGNDPDAVAKLALIREILGDDTEVVALKKEVADLKAHLALVREAVGLDFGDDDK